MGDARLLIHGYLNDGMEALFHLHLWDQSHVTIVWNTRETGDIYYYSCWYSIWKLGIQNGFSNGTRNLDEKSIFQELHHLKWKV